MMARTWEARMRRKRGNSKETEEVERNKKGEISRGRVRE